MKQIELTTEHRIKLLKMCKKLFPEFNFELSDEYCDLCTVDTLFIWDINKEFRDAWNQWIRIHWYEFCNTWLVEKIFNPIPSAIQRDLKERMSDYFWKSNVWWSEKYIGELDSDGGVWCEHPIDYLYKEFKKLKI